MIAEKILDEGVCGFNNIRILRQTILEHQDFIDDFDKRAIYKVEIQISGMTGDYWHTLAEWSTNYANKAHAVLEMDIIKCKMKAKALFNHMVQYGKL